MTSPIVRSTSTKKNNGRSIPLRTEKSLNFFLTLLSIPEGPVFDGVPSPRRLGAVLSFARTAMKRHFLSSTKEV